MVDFFFVLSGFVIAMNYNERIKNRVDLRRFCSRRFWRLYPLHITTLLIMLLLEFSKFLLDSFDLMTLFSPAFGNNNFPAFIAHILLIHGFTGFELTFNGPSWSISTEFYTYLLFGLIIYKRKFKVKMMLSVAVLSSFVLAKYDFTEFGNLLLLRCFWAFFIGSLGFYVHQKYSRSISEIFTLFSLLVSIFAVCFFGHTYQLIFPLLFLVSILCLCNTDQNSSFLKVLNSKPLVYLGTISYSIYMNHLILWYLSGIFLVRSGWFEVVMNESGARELILSPMESSVLVVFLMCFLIAISSLTYRFVEMKFKNGLSS